MITTKTQKPGPGEGARRELVREVVLACGLCWEGYRRKWRTVWPAVRSSLEEFGGQRAERLAEALRRDPRLREILRPRLTVTVSRFFRARKTFDTLLRLAAFDLPLRGEVPGWSAGCACGEEPYTLAILWEEQVRPSRPDLRLRLLATDTREDCLERARLGAYPAGALKNVPAGLLARWFEPVEGGYRVRPVESVAIEFRRGDLLRDEPPAGCRLALCRNVAFTYFGTDLQELACRQLARALVPGGLLAIGERECLPRIAVRGADPLPGPPSRAREEGPRLPAPAPGEGAREAFAFGPVPGDRTVFWRLPA